MSDKSAKGVNVSAATSKDGGRSMTTRDTYAKPTTPLTVPLREIDTMESITLGFRASMFEIKDKQGNGGELLTTAGFGGDAIIMEWKEGDTERKVMIRGTELLAAWVETFDTEAAESIRKLIA